jgi:hypothetical protein
MSRFTIEFTEEADKGLEEVQRKLHATTKADVIRKAVNLLNFVVQEQEKGGKLIVENPKENLRKEIVTLWVPTMNEIGVRETPLDKPGATPTVHHVQPTQPGGGGGFRVFEQGLRRWTATLLAFGLLLIFGLTVVPPIWIGLHQKLDPEMIDLVKWMVAVEIAALGTVFGFYFSEERRA